MRNLRTFTSIYSKYYCYIDHNDYNIPNELEASCIHIIKTMTDFGSIYSFRIMFFDRPIIIDFNFG